MPPLFMQKKSKEKMASLVMKMVIWKLWLLYDVVGGWEVYTLLHQLILSQKTGPARIQSWFDVSLIKIVIWTMHTGISVKAYCTTSDIPRRHPWKIEKEEVKSWKFWGKTMIQGLQKCQDRKCILKKVNTLKK